LENGNVISAYKGIRIFVHMKNTSSPKQSVIQHFFSHVKFLCQERETHLHPSQRHEIHENSQGGEEPMSKLETGIRSTGEHGPRVGERWVLISQEIDYTPWTLQVFGLSQ
jgi:hypothetical protein